MRISKWPCRWQALTGIAAALAVASAQVVLASTWNERTVLTFSEPVIVPGATLQPGSYVFQIADAMSGRHTIEIRSEDGTELVTLAQAVPVKREDVKGEIVVQFNPTDTGSPPAVKGWFYPGSLYGHQFVYPDEQAREIARRSRSIVLSVDVPGTDLERGTLHLIDPAGALTEWREDASAAREWDAWRKNRGADAARTADAADGRSPASAPMADAPLQGTRVRLDDLEEHTQKYTGRTISVDGEVEEVYGPRMFTIDEPEWGDLDGEIIVVVPGPLAAMVREDDRLTVTGTVKPYVRAEFMREWGWLGLDPDLEVEVARKPVLQATRIVGGNNDLAMIVDVNKAADRPVGTTGGGEGEGSLTDPAAIAGGTDRLVGRNVSLTGVEVARVATGGAFFVKAEDSSLFVLPARADAVTVSAGDTVSIEGVVLQLPEHMRDQLNVDDEADTYVYATVVNES